MGLETATFIHQLDVNNPVGATDPKGQGDDHLRLIKAALKATFPNFTGAVTATQDALNTAFLSNVYSPIASSLSNLNQLNIVQNFFWLQIGNIVVVAGRITPVSTIDANPASGRLSLPVAPAATTFGNATSAAGIVAGPRAVDATTTQTGSITSVNGAAAVLLSWTKGPANNNDVLFAYKLN